MDLDLVLHVDADPDSDPDPACHVKKLDFIFHKKCLAPLYLPTRILNLIKNITV